MKVTVTTIALILAGLFVAGFALADSATISGYTISNLLSPCVNADNDSREGAQSETECEQYIKGFTDAYLQITPADSRTICLPVQNRPDEVRWVFTKWAIDNYDRRNEPAATGLMEALEAKFACP